MHNDQLYIVKERYQYRSNDGIAWTTWFTLNSTPMSERTANDCIKTTKRLYDDIDKKTKLYHEYKLVPIEKYYEEIQNMNERIAEGQRRDEEYYQSDEWKELKHKKYVAKKERIRKQEAYKQMMEQLS